MTSRLFTIVSLVIASTGLSGVAFALPSAHSPANDRACVEQLNSLSERIYAQQLNLTQLKAQIGDDEITNSGTDDRVASSRVDAVDLQIKQRERAQRSIGVVAQLVYGQRAGAAAMNYVQALKYAQHNFLLELQQPGAPNLALPEIERVGKQLRKGYGSCTTAVPSFGAFIDTALRDRGVTVR